MASSMNGVSANHEEYKRKMWRFYDPVPPTTITYVDYRHPYDGTYYSRNPYRQRCYGYYPGRVYGYNSMYSSSVVVNRGLSNVMLGPLPSDFLVVPSSDPATQRIQQEQNDYAVAAQLQMGQKNQQLVGRLQVTVVRATLNKNYGMTRMDPYCKLHFGTQVFESQTCINGAKNPVWNKTFYIYQLPKTVKSFLIELYDERSLSDDERIAWTQVPLPANFNPDTHSDQWYNLSGKLGEELEGKVHIIIAFENTPAPVYGGAPMMLYGGMNPTYSGGLVPVYIPQNAATSPAVHQQQPPPPPITEEDVKQVATMFPDTEEEVIKSVLEASNNNKEAAVEALLAMQQSS